MKLRFLNFVLILLLTLIAVPLEAEEADTAGRAIIVLDASGSMWGQVEGRSKIEIAREALENLVQEWPEGRELGLVAYGHRRKGDCEDIELLVEPGKLTAGKVVEVSKSLNPVGKTPLSASVRLAAEALKYTEDKATVILLSDGIETCDLNPCDVGTELEKLGIDFTAHVIGFDIKDAAEQQGLRCLAENTGGMFFTADNARELRAALSKAAEVEEVPEVKDESPATPEAPKARLEAPDEAVKGTVVKVTHFFEDETSDEEVKNLGELHLHYPNAKRSFTYSRVKASKTGEAPVTEIRLPAEAGSYVLRWISPKRELIAERTIAATEAEIAIIAPDSAIGGGTLTVQIEAPAGLVGSVNLHRKGVERSITYQRVNTSARGEYKVAPLRLPMATGEYVLRWVSPNNQLIAERDLIIEEATTSLSVPESVSAGTAIPITVTGSEGLAGYVHLRKQGIEKDISYERVQTNARGEYQVRPLRAPAMPGEYLLEWRTQNKELLDSKTITVLDADISLSAPEEPFQGTEIAVVLQGPDGLSGYVHLRKKGLDKDVTYNSIRQAATGGYEPTKLRLPMDVGSYVLSFRTRSGEELASKEIVLKEVEAAVKASSQLLVGEPIEVELSAPAGLSGYVHLYEQGNEKSLTYESVRSGSLENYARVKLKAQERPGVYELRWLTATGEPIAATQVEVVEEKSEVSDEEGETAAASEVEESVAVELAEEEDAAEPAVEGDAGEAAGEEVDAGEADEDDAVDHGPEAAIDEENAGEPVEEEDDESTAEQAIDVDEHESVNDEATSETSADDDVEAPEEE